MRQAAPRGLTLIEVAVILAILFVLVALAMPAVTIRCWRSTRAACVNNLKQLALAALTYESAHGVLPPAFGRTPTIDVAGHRRPSAQVAILPFLARQELYDAFNFQFDLGGVADHPLQDPNLTAASVQVWTFLCPADPSGAKLLGRLAGGNYLASIGATACPELGPAPPGSPAGVMEPDRRLAGIFNVTLDRDAPAALADGAPNPDYRRVAGWSTVASVADGLATTALFSETLRSGSVRLGPEEVPPDGPATVYGVPTAAFTTASPPAPATCRAGRRTAYRGQMYFLAAAPTSFYSHTQPPNAAAPDCANVDADFVAGHVAARSAHPGGVHVSFADGSVRFLKDAIDPSVWRALGTKAGGEAVADGSH